MDTSQWPQEQQIGVVNYIEGSSNIINTSCTKPPLIENIRRTKPQKDQVLNCPRCNSTNTKFCYYNNYSLTQPRYFCKTCRRYWTEGGTLRNIPVGGVSRKNKRSSPSSSSSSKIDSSSKVFIHDHMIINNNNNNPSSLPNLSQFSSQNPKNVALEGQDLNLSFQAAAQDYHHDHHGMVTQFVEMPQIASRVLNSFIPMPVPPPPDSNMLYSSSSSLGFPLHEMKPASLGFSVEGLRSTNGHGGFGNFHGISSGNNGNGMLLFPFGEVMKQPHSSTTTTSTSEVDHNKLGQGNPNHGYWNGMLGGGAAW